MWGLTNKDLKNIKKFVVCSDLKGSWWFLLESNHAVCHFWADFKWVERGKVNLVLLIYIFFSSSDVYHEQLFSHFSHTIGRTSFKDDIDVNRVSNNKSMKSWLYKSIIINLR